MTLVFFFHWHLLKRLKFFCLAPSTVAYSGFNSIGSAAGRLIARPRKCASLNPPVTLKYSPTATANTTLFSCHFHSLWNIQCSFMHTSTLLKPLHKANWHSLVFSPTLHTLLNLSWREIERNTHCSFWTFFLKSLAHVPGKLENVVRNCPSTS